MIELKNMFENFGKVGKAKAIEFGAKSMIGKSRYIMTFVELYVLVAIAYLMEHGSDHYEKWEEEDLTVQAITEYSFITNASAVADRLVRAKFLTRKECAKDRRYVFFKVTDNGRRLLESFEVGIKQFMPEEK